MIHTYNIYNVVAIISGHIFYFGITEFFIKFDAHIAH